MNTPESENPKRLGALDDRRRSVRFAPRDQSHSNRVTRLRLLLPLAAVAIIAVLMIWPKIEAEISERRLAPSKLDKAALQQAATQNRLLSANFSSVDSKGRPFTITSEEAVQQTDNPDNVQLKSPKGTVQLDETDTLEAKSVSGLYAQGEQHLTLNENVVITRSDGTTLKTQKLFVNLKTNESSTDVPVVIDGPQGHLTAAGMVVKNGGAVTVFPGPAKLILNTGGSIDPTKKGKS